jgi:hypothetical protein
MSAQAKAKTTGAKSLAFGIFQCSVQDFLCRPRRNAGPHSVKTAGQGPIGYCLAAFTTGDPHNQFLRVIWGKCTTKEAVTEPSSMSYEDFQRRYRFFRPWCGRNHQSILDVLRCPPTECWGVHPPTPLLLAENWGRGLAESP